MKKQIQINPADNVVVAVDTLSAGDHITVGTTTVTVREEIPAGHKVALQDFKTATVAGTAMWESVTRYGLSLR